MQSGVGIGGFRGWIVPRRVGFLFSRYCYANGSRCMIFGFFFFFANFFSVKILFFCLVAEKICEGNKHNGNCVIYSFGFYDYIAWFEIWLLEGWN